MILHIYLGRHLITRRGRGDVTLRDPTTRVSEKKGHSKSDRYSKKTVFQSILASLNLQRVSQKKSEVRKYKRFEDEMKYLI